MTRKMLKLGLMIAIVASVMAAAVANDGSRWWSYVEFLASDSLEGRNTGSEGHKKAADYVAAQFERAGLKPAGEQGYIQPVKFKTLELDESASSLALVRDGRSNKTTLGEEAIIGTRVEPAASVEAQLVFVGYGLRIPEASIDDFAGLDVKGKIAVYLSGAPTSVPAALSSHYQSQAERGRLFQSLGIVGSVILQNPHHMDVPWARIAANRTQMTMQLADPGRTDPFGQKIGVTWNPGMADLLFAGTGHTFEAIVDSAEAGRTLPRFKIPSSLVAKATLKRGEVVSQNIAAIYPGTDPVLKNEYVVLSAHIDHLGKANPPVKGDAVFNGAMDNASGVGILLNTAAHLKETAPKLKRSILLVAVTGEEKGLLGSKYFNAKPTVPSQQIVANINTDMFLPLHPLKLLTVYGLAESSLGDDVTATAKSMGVRVQPDPEPQRNIFIRSDQYNFILKGIPAITFKFGAEKGSKEETIQKEWLANRYHAVGDDLNQPIDKIAAGQFIDMVQRILVRIADAPEKPAWKKESFFRRYAAK